MSPRTALVISLSSAPSPEPICRHVIQTVTHWRLHYAVGDVTAILQTIPRAALERSRTDGAEDETLDGVIETRAEILCSSPEYFTFSCFFANFFLNAGFHLSTQTDVWSFERRNKTRLIGACMVLCGITKGCFLQPHIHHAYLASIKRPPITLRGLVVCF